MFSELLETCRNNENTMSDLYFNGKSHCSEENTSDNEDHSSTISVWAWTEKTCDNESHDKETTEAVFRRYSSK